MTRLAFQGPLLAASKTAAPPPPAGIELHVEDTAQLVQASLTTTFTVPLPANRSAGDRVIILLASRDEGSTAGHQNVPAGWTRSLYRSEQNQRFGLYERVLDGGEGASVDITTTEDHFGVALAMRVTGHSAADATEAGTPAFTGFGSAIDVPALAPTGGSAEYLWLALGWGRRGGDRTFSSLTNYAHDAEDLFVDVGSGSAGEFIAVAWRILETDEEDPGDFTMSGNISSWGVCLAAVTPEGA